MIVVKGSVATKSGDKYVQQLCKHWAHKLPVKVEGSTGTVTFPGSVVQMIGMSDALELTISGNDGAEVKRMKDVIERHLDRFAFREAPLPYEWKAP